MILKRKTKKTSSIDHKLSSADAHYPTLSGRGRTGQGTLGASSGGDPGVRACVRVIVHESDD